MSPNKTLYIREEDQDVWARAAAAAHTARVSLSQFVTELIRHHVPDVPAVEAEMSKITVDVGDGRRMWREGFTGRWLAWEAVTGERKNGIALTKGGQFVWYEATPLTSTGRIDIYASMAELAGGVYEARQDETHKVAFRALVAEAEQSLGQVCTIWLDI